ncbi:MAG TPA: adenylate/guanylate cyclase domain-containing protein [Leptolyngbyaceae cyanobacterium M33_DOE_097]|uniref:Adenylate/guanylate cyclase domain-containing protein n=1 Tax=Oscillatoriales cyanobacterium SpSt-418 TaxID=2282169 RepID=A0A7C3KDX8_9CYAN|nr:adenylate/guanylate cyclase domain-containing protein [Leptolyngbyaceae cyanobacterium M33_DOE_097]
MSQEERSREDLLHEIEQLHWEVKHLTRERRDLSALVAILMDHSDEVTTRHVQDLLKLTTAYERFVPREFLQLLGKANIADVSLGDQIQKEMTILFADIVNFTSLSEKMTPAETFRFINVFLSYMEPCVRKNHGFIDKYIGDGIMALFNNTADNAVRAGIAMLKTVQEFNQHVTPAINIGIGINTGLLMLGTIGDEHRMDSTVISDAVNLAARLEKLTREYGITLLISHDTFAQLQQPEQYFIRKIDQVKVKGKSEAITVYEVFDADPPNLRNGKLETAEMFATALDLYETRKFRDATELFFNCINHNPGDTVVKNYLEKCYNSRFQILQEL